MKNSKKKPDAVTIAIFAVSLCLVTAVCFYAAYTHTEKTQAPADQSVAVAASLTTVAQPPTATHPWCDKLGGFDTPNSADPALNALISVQYNFYINRDGAAVAAAYLKGKQPDPNQISEAMSLIAPGTQFCVVPLGRAEDGSYLVDVHEQPPGQPGVIYPQVVQVVPDGHGLKISGLNVRQ